MPTVKKAAKKAAKAPKPTKPAKASKTVKASKPAKPTKPAPPVAEAKPPRIFAMSFASVYVLYIQKVERKGRTQAELNQVVRWLTGYTAAQLRRAIDTRIDFTGFFGGAPQLNPKVALVKGVVCGVRVEDVADPLMQKIRYLDLLVDELARGKSMDKVLRA